MSLPIAVHRGSVTALNRALHHGCCSPTSLTTRRTTPLAVDLPLGNPGTLLCLGGPGEFLFFVAAPGEPFDIPVPHECSAVGFQLCTQGLSIDGADQLLTNALDITLGSF